MKGKIIKTDKEWMVEIQSDLHGYGIGWGDPMIYPLFIIDENIWEGKEVEVEPIQYDSNFLPVIVKIKTNNMGERIITFGCSESIHIYTSQSSVTPMWPYKSHKSIEDAKKHLTELRGIKEPKIIHN
jgi:hypothetical protein